MAETCQRLQWQVGETKGAHQYQRCHCGNGDCAKEDGDKNHTQGAVRRGRIHEQRNERLAGAENKNGKENPGCYSAISRCVSMRVIPAMGVHMLMFGAARMSVNVRVWLVADGSVDAPGAVNQAKGYEQPRGNIAADRFRYFERVQSQPGKDADETQNDRPEDVSQAAQDSYPRRFDE